MNIKFKNDTAEVLKSELSKKGKSAIRIVIQGIGWGGPKLGIVLDEQQNDDIVCEVDGLKVVAEKDLSPMLSNTLISYSKGLFGNSFKVSSDASSNC